MQAAKAELERRPAIWWLTLLVLAYGLVRLGHELGSHWSELGAGGELRCGLLLGLRLLALAVAAGALGRLVTRRGAAGAAGVSPPSAERFFAGAAGVLLSAVLIGTAVDLAFGPEGDRFATRSAFRSVLLLAVSLWLGRLCGLPRWAVAARWTAPTWLRVVLVNLLLGLSLLEAVALGFAYLFPSRLLWDESSAQATLEANRLEPGWRYFGFPANSGGYYDEEFHVAGPDDLVVALLADSFGLGIVPYRHNFATVTERLLERWAPVDGRVAVNNYGVASIGLPEYAWLLEHEVAATSPNRVVLALFVGNDISELASHRRPGHYSLRQLQLFELGRRLVRLRRLPPGSASLGRPNGARRGPPPQVEGGTFDEATFLEIERTTVEMCNTRSWGVARLYGTAFDWLETIHRLAGDRLLVMLIPDEYQVNDELWETLMRRVAAAPGYDRTYPQQRLAAFCRLRGIEVLDLLPLLRRAHLERPVYRPRDTHWNARGNRVAGEALARHLVGRGQRPDAGAERSAGGGEEQRQR